MPWMTSYSHPRARPHRRALGREHHPVEDRPDPLGVRIADVVVHLGEVGNHVRRGPPGGDHVVDARLLGHVLAQHVDHVVHGLDPVQRRPPLLRGARRMRGNPVEAELGRLVGQRRRRAGTVAVPGVPVDHRVHVAEEPAPHHVDLARAAFLGGRAIDPYGPGGAGRRQPVLHGQAGRHRARTEEVMPTGVTRAHRRPRQPLRAPALGDSGQRVELGQDADDRGSFSPAGDEGGRHPRDPGLDLEAGVGELSLQQARALRLLVPDLGKIPDLLRDRAVAGCVGLHMSQHRLVAGLGSGGGGGREAEQGDEEQGEGGGGALESLFHRCLIGSEGGGIRGTDQNGGPT